MNSNQTGQKRQGVSSTPSSPSSPSATAPTNQCKKQITKASGCPNDIVDSFSDRIVLEPDTGLIVLPDKLISSSSPSWYNLKLATKTACYYQFFQYVADQPTPVSQLEIDNRVVYCATWNSASNVSVAQTDEPVKEWLKWLKYTLHDNIVTKAQEVYKQEIIDRANRCGLRCSQTDAKYTAFDDLLYDFKHDTKLRKIFDETPVRFFTLTYYIFRSLH